MAGALSARIFSMICGAADTLWSFAASLGFRAVYFQQRRNKVIMFLGLYLIIDLRGI